MNEWMGKWINEIKGKPIQCTIHFKLNLFWDLRGYWINDMLIITMFER